jgi:hypothetical protein
MGIEFADGRRRPAVTQWGGSGIRLLREGGPGALSDPVLEEKSSPESEAEQAVFCRDCSHPITTAQELFSIDGSQTHTFFNPAGIIFEIICFTAAPGCIIQSEASSNFSWFSGFTWRVAFCGNCFTHLGWFFESGESSFFGLILKKLAGV